MTEAQAREAVRRLLADLSSRSGCDVIENLEEDLQEEIRERWTAILLEVDLGWRPGQ